VILLADGWKLHHYRRWPVVHARYGLVDSAAQHLIVAVSLMSIYDMASLSAAPPVSPPRH
jgi:hypothetical protein